MSSTTDTSCRWRQKEEERSVEDNSSEVFTYKGKTCHDRFLKWKNLDALPAETEPKKNVYQGSIHHPAQLNILGLWAVMLCDTKKCGPLAEKNKQANKKTTTTVYINCVVSWYHEIHIMYI